MDTIQDDPQSQLPTFEGYRTIRWLGSGGFSNVYLVADDSGNRYALKHIKPEVIAKDPETYSKRFEREAQLQMGLHQPHRHPHIVRIYTYSKEHMYLVMDYADGGTLEKQLNDTFPRGTDLQTALTVVTQIGSALAYMHEKADQQHGGIVHLDLKPSNILVQHVPAPQGEEEWGYLVADFSMAHALSPGGQPDGGSSLFDGTARYMAPEQAAQGSAGRPGPKADIYTLGVILHQMLSGKLPRPGEPPSPLRTLNDTLPRAVEAVVQKATARNLDDRYGSMKGFVKDFTDAVAAATPGASRAETQQQQTHKRFTASASSVLRSPFYSSITTLVLLGIIIWFLVQISPVTHFTLLGGLDLGKYCQSLGYQQNVGVTSCSATLNMDQVCNWQYETINLQAKFLNPSQPSSENINCYDSRGNRLGGISDIDGYCQDQRHGYRGTSTANSVGTGWVCQQQLNLALVCMWQYDRTDVQARSNDQGIWNCYGLF